MKIKLNKKESLEYFKNALINNDFMSITRYNLEKQAEYKIAKEMLDNGVDSIRFEDVLIQGLLMGFNLELQDCSGDNHIISLDDVYKKVQKTNPHHLMNMVNGNDDSITADVILQTVVFGEIIFG
jgi:hypothetical protein